MPGADSGAVGLASLLDMPREPDFLDRLHDGTEADTGFDTTNPLIAEFIRAVIAAAVLLERSPLGGAPGPQLRTRRSVAQAWRDLAEEAQEGDVKNVVYLPSASRPPTDGQMCTLFAVDIVGFTRPRRDDDIRLYLHEKLYEFMQRAFEDSGIRWTGCFCEDRGDGALVVIPPEIAGKAVVDPLPERLRGLIRRHNHVSSDAARIQLRTAAHIGPVEHDGHGFVGTDINLLFRMLDARTFKRTLATSGADLGFIVSDYVYRSLVCRYPSLVRPDGFRTVRFQAKHTRAQAWTYYPGEPPAQHLYLFGPPPSPP